MNLTQSIHSVHIGGHAHVQAGDILFCEGDRNYSRVHFRSRRPLTVSTHLGLLEARLATRGFVRVSRSALVNKECILDYDNFEITLTNGLVLPIARRRRVRVRRWLVAQNFSYVHPTNFKSISS